MVNKRKVSSMYKKVVALVVILAMVCVNIGTIDVDAAYLWESEIRSLVAWCDGTYDDYPASGYDESIDISHLSIPYATQKYDLIDYVYSLSEIQGFEWIESCSCNYYPSSGVCAYLLINVKDEYLDSNGMITVTDNIYKDAKSAMNVDYRTKEEILEYLEENPIDLNKATTYASAPVLTSPYSAGVLSDAFLEDALNTLNAIRFIAGLDYDVQLKDSYNEMAQAASLVNKVNGVLTHYPTQPSDMSDELYQLGADGASSSNIACGYSTLNRAMIQGFMHDGDWSNIDRVGHRRWILNPSMAYVGFGAVNEGYPYYAMYAFGGGGDGDQYGVAWPAQTMPVEYFGTDYPWSFSLGSLADESSVNVKLTNVNTGEEWKFSSEEAEGAFYVNNDGYGQSGCIIFRPDVVDGYKDGDVYRVEITGLNAKGYESSVTYDVNFISITPVLYGDANSDGKINVMDAVLMKKHIAGFENLTINLDACDVNLDTRINVMDAVMVLKYIAGFDVVLGE